MNGKLWKEKELSNKNLIDISDWNAVSQFYQNKSVLRLLFLYQVAEFNDEILVLSGI